MLSMSVTKVVLGSGLYSFLSQFQCLIVKKNTDNGTREGLGVHSRIDKGAQAIVCG